MKNKNHHRVNWVDGMKINKTHFIEQENAFLTVSVESAVAGINKVNYGLLPAGSLEEDALDLSISMDGQDSVNIQLKLCKAITKGGYRINITPEISDYLEQAGQALKTNFSFTEEKEDCYVVLSVNPFVRLPFGNANTDEEPPRHPYVLPEYKIHIIQQEEINSEEFGLNHLTISKITFDNGVAALADDFIPPCCSVQSHQDLRYVFDEIDTYLHTLDNYCLNIIQKIRQKEQSNHLAKMVQTITENMMQYLGSILPNFKLYQKHQPPVVFISSLVALARVLKQNIDIYANAGKEELLNYLSKWSGDDAGHLENVLGEMIELQYQHTDINKSLIQIPAFTKLTLTLFKKLKELDYIGEKDSPGFFIKQDVVEKAPKSKRSFLLDD